MTSQPAVPGNGEIVARPTSFRALAFVGETLARQRPWVIFLLSLAISAAIGYLDFITSWEVSLFVFYAIPILLTAWFAGLGAGLVLALICGAIWWAANLPSNPYATSWGYPFAMLNRLGYFVFVAVGARAIRRKQEVDARQITMLQEMRQMEQEIIKAGEAEQQRIGQDLHDGLCQQLAAIGCAARALADDLSERAVPESADAEKIEEAIQRTVLEARCLARGIFPVHVDQSGLSAALSELAQVTSRLTGIAVEFSESPEVQVGDPEVAMHFYRIAQEALANAVRHGMAQKVEVSLRSTGDQLELRVDDDGKGILDANGDRAGGMGLRTMTYRAHAIGADLAIHPRAGGGTSVCCTLRFKTHEMENKHAFA